MTTGHKPLDDLAAVVAAVVDEPVWSYTESQRREALRTIQAAQDALDAAKASHLHWLEGTRGYEADGASSLRTWCRSELRLEPAEARSVCASASTMSDLPDVGRAARAGEIRGAHVREFTYGIRHIGREIVAESVPWLLDLATACEPGQLHQAMRALRESVYPDELDKAWARGMDKRDFQVNAVPEGWHVNGFLDTITGAKMRSILDSYGAPRDAEDQRSGAERRVQALEEMADSILESGLPTDHGVRPHISVLVDAHSLGAALQLDAPGQPMFGHETTGYEDFPAQLLGFGSIGPQLLSYLTCTSEITPVVADGETGGPLPQARVLNVGRTSRLATPKQRQAVLTRQDGVCAAPGCMNTHLDVHHAQPWSEGGQTDLDNLIGLCPPCHRLVHRHLLSVQSDHHGGFTVSRTGGSIDKSNRTMRARQYRAAWRRRRNAAAPPDATRPAHHVEPQRTPGHQRV